MKGFVQNIEGIAVQNNNFRQVLYTAKNSQLVVMSLKPGEEIGMEVHKLDQFFRVEEGTGEAILDGVQRRSKQALPYLSLLGKITISSITAVSHSNSIRSIRRRIIGTALSTIPALMRRRTVNISTVKQQNNDH